MFVQSGGEGTHTVFFHDYAAIAHVAGSGCEGAQYGFAASRRKQFREAVERFQELDNEPFAGMHFAPGREIQRGRRRAQIRRKTSVVDVDADSGNDVIVHELRQDSGDFLLVDEHVIRPAQVAGDMARFLDRFRCGQTDQQARNRQIGGHERQVENNRGVNARFGLRDPLTPEPAHSGRLLIGKYDRAGASPGCDQACGSRHCRADAREIVERVLGTLLAERNYIKRHSELQIKADVHRNRRVRDGSTGDVVGAGFGVSADIVQPDVARKFYGRALIDHLDPFAGLLGSEIVEQQMFGAGIQRFLQFLARADLDLNRAGERAGFFKCGSNASGSGDVVVFDQNSVEETLPVIHGAAGRRRIFFEQPQAGRGLARIQYLYAGTADGLNILAGQCGDSAQPLDKVKRHAFAFKQGSRSRRDGRNRIAVLNRIAALPVKMHARTAAEIAANRVDKRPEFHSGENEVIFGDKLSFGPQELGNGEFGGYVTVADIFVQRALDGIADLRMIDVEHFVSGRFTLVEQAPVLLEFSTIFRELFAQGINH